MVPMLAAATGPVNGLFFSETDHDRLTRDDDPENDALAGFMNVNIRDTGRNLMIPGEGSVGAFLFGAAARGAAQALARDAGALAPGKLADLMAIDSHAPPLCALSRDELLDGLVFAAKDSVVTDVWSAGRHQVRGGRHIAREAVFARYRGAMSELLDV